MVIVKLVNGSLELLSASLHLGGEKLLSVSWAVASTVLHRLLEVLSLLRHDYQSGLILTERANLL